MSSTQTASRIIALPKLTAESLTNKISSILTSGYDCPSEESIQDLLCDAIRSPHHLWYFSNALGRCLSSNNIWAVSCKGLMLLHRLLRSRSLTVQLDVSSLILSSPGSGQPAMDLESMAISYKEKPGTVSAQRTEVVQSYARYILQRSRTAPDPASASHVWWKGHSNDDILDWCGKLQDLMLVLVDFLPDGAVEPSRYIFLTVAMELVLRDSFLVYSGVNYGIVELVERFGTLSRDQALKSLEIYRRAAQQAEKLTNLYAKYGEMGIGKSAKFPVVSIMAEESLRSLEESLNGGSSETSNSLTLQLVPFGQSPASRVDPRLKSIADQQFDDTWRTLFGFSSSTSPPPPTAGSRQQLAVMTPPRQSDDLLVHGIYQAAEAQNLVLRRWGTGSGSGVDPFAASNNVPAPPYVQMAVRAQQQLAMMLQQQLTAQYNAYYQKLGPSAASFNTQQLLAGPFNNARNPNNVGVQYGNVLIPYS